MSLKIIKAGLLDTIQDLGRFGYQHLGINPGGAMDRFSAQVSNLLVGNDLNEPVIEMHFPASALLFEQISLIAICGGDFQPEINGIPVPLNHPILINKNGCLQFTQKREGERAYLAVKGLKVLPWLNSATTNLKIGAGGYKGRALIKNDVIEIKDDHDHFVKLGGKDFIALPFKVDLKFMDETKDTFVLPGNEWDCLNAEQQSVFISSEFTVSKAADRMGFQLEGPAIHFQMKEELVSTGVGFGTIQLLPNGQLIVLMADHQSTGGYPRIAHVAMARTSSLAQKGPGEKIKFRIIDHYLAEQLLIRQQQHLLQLKNACKFRLTEFFS